MLKKLRKGLSFLLVFCMVLSMFPTGVLAADDGELPEVVAAEEAATDAQEASDAPEMTMGTKPNDGTTTGNPFVKGTGGSNSFRIPAMVTLSDGTIVAAADARWNTTYDGGGLDTIVSYSTDNGANWNYTFANYLGDNDNTYNGSGSTAFIDPALATDGETVYMLCDLYPYGVALNGSGNTAPSTAVGFNDDGTLKLAVSGSSTYNYYLNDGKIYDSSNNAVSGLTVDTYFNVTGTYNSTTYDTNLFFSDSPFKVVRTGFLYLTKSTDGGTTWSAPTLIPNVKTTSEQVCLVGPGRGLVTSKGMIVFPVYSFHGDNDASSNTQRLSFVYSTDQGETWSRTSELDYDWASEAAVVELRDGTLRFFFRNGTKQLCYVDYADGAWGTPVQTSNYTNSNTQISAISYSGTVDGKQVILVSCPTGSGSSGSNSSSASDRLNGKIFVGLVNSDKTMDWSTGTSVSLDTQHSDQYNYFMYSCLTELANGNIAILYEDNESAWGTGDGYYYQMSYSTIDASSFGLTFDAEQYTDVFPDEATGVEVTLVSESADTYAGWTMTVTAGQTVDAISTNYNAFEIIIQNSDSSQTYKDSAKVTLPVGSLNTAKGLYGFVVNSDGTIDKATDGQLSEDGVTFTFTAPHFSIVGLAENETLTEYVYLTVGGTKVITDTTGNYESSYTGEGLDTSKAKVTVSGSDATTDGSYAQADSITSGKQYLITINGNHVVTNTEQNKTYSGASAAGLMISSVDNIAYGYNLEQYLWTITRSGEGYTIQNANGKYLTIGSENNNVTLSDTAQVLTVTDNGDTFDFSNGSYYLNNFGGDSKHASSWTTGSGWTLYEYTPGSTAGTTTITFEGVAVGETTAKVGNTNYNIIVTATEVTTTRDVTLTLGESYNDTVTGNYGSDDIYISDNSIANVTVGESVPGASTAVSTGKTYLLYNNRSSKLLTSTTQSTGLLLDGTVAVDGESWTITAVDGVENGFTVQNSAGKYLSVGGNSATLSDASETLLLVYADGFWTISDSTNTYHLNHYGGGNSVKAAGDNGAITDGGSQWLFYEIDNGKFVNANTPVTITGKSAGTAVAIVGNTRYNITVNRKTQTVYVPAGGTVTCTDTSTSTTATVADETYATATLTDGTLTISGVTEGTTTVTTDTTVYTVNVTTATGTDVALTINQGSSKAISVTLEDGQYVKWTSANSSYVGVAGMYDAEKLVYTNAAELFGQQMTTEETGPIKVTGTIYNSDGTVASTCTWLVTVIAPAEGTTSVKRYYDVDQVENCTMYYSINGGELVQVNGSGVIIPGENDPVTVIDGTWYGDLSLMFFAAPYDGYALTHLYVEDSANQYYVLSDGVGSDGDEDVTKSSAWPFKDGIDPEAVYTTDGHTYSVEEIASLYKLGDKSVYGTVHASNDIWKVNNDSRHGFRWALLEGYVTPTRLRELYEAARALGCTGVTTVTKGSTNNTNTGTAADPISICAVAQPLASIHKEVTKITDKTGADVTAAGIVKIGYTVSYKLTVTVPATPRVAQYWDGDDIKTATEKTDSSETPIIAAISYTDMKVTDTLSGYANEEFSWTQNTATSSTTEGDDTTYTKDYTITLTKDNFGNIVKDGAIKNTATLDYNFTASYGTGNRSSSDEKVLNVTVDIPRYVVDFGLPLEINLSDNTDGAGSITKVENGKYGTAKLNDAGNGFTYTPTETLKGVDYVKFQYTQGDNTYEYSVAIYPATTVYYEEGFADYLTSWDKYQGNENTGKGNQTASVVGSKANYGYDAWYAAQDSGPSDKTEAVSPWNTNDRATFTFTGTGVDVYANCTPETGVVMIELRQYDDENDVYQFKRLFAVDTIMKKGKSTLTQNQAVDGYNIPIVSLTDLEYGNYLLRIAHVKAGNDEESRKEGVKLDGFRVYGTLDNEENKALHEEGGVYSQDLEDNPTFIEMRDAVLTAQSVDTNQSIYASQIAGQVYSQVSSESIDTPAGAIILDTTADTLPDNAFQDLLDNGPKNELYLQPGQALVFKITTNREVQIGLKALNKATSYSIAVDNSAVKTDTNFTSSTDMFYTVLYSTATATTQTITITNNGDGILSITKLKICDDPDAALGQLTEEDLVDALVSLGFEESAATRFDDITESKWYYNAVEFVTGRGYFVGVTDNLFGPEQTMTRGMFVTVLGRAAKVNKADYANKDTGFTDVKPGAYYAPYVAWAKENGIVFGKTETEFCPNMTVTREEMAAFMCRFARYLGLDTTVKDSSWMDRYTDAGAISTYARNSIGWCVETGIITGTSSTTVSPKNLATRAQVATVIKNLVQKVIERK